MRLPRRSRYATAGVACSTALSHLVSKSYMRLRRNNILKSLSKYGAAQLDEKQQIKVFKKR